MKRSYLHAYIWILAFILLLVYLVLLTGCNLRQRDTTILWSSKDCLFYGKGKNIRISEDDKDKFKAAGCEITINDEAINAD